MSGRVKGRPIRLATEIADDVPTALMGDPRRIRQVTNLLSNALRFTDEGTLSCVVALMANNGGRSGRQRLRY
ncbi:MAG: hypothetical protein ACLRP3_05515 [Escherichia sp.]